MIHLMSQDHDFAKLSFGSSLVNWNKETSSSRSPDLYGSHNTVTSARAHKDELVSKFLQLQEDTAFRINSLHSTPRRVSAGDSQDFQPQPHARWTSASFPTSPGALLALPSYPSKHPTEVEGIAGKEGLLNVFQSQMNPLESPWNAQWQAEKRINQSSQLNAGQKVQQKAGVGSLSPFTGQESVTRQDGADYLSPLSRHLLQLHARKIESSSEPTLFKLPFATTPLSEIHETATKSSHAAHYRSREEPLNACSTANHHKLESISSFGLQWGTSTAQEWQRNDLNGHLKSADLKAQKEARHLKSGNLKAEEEGIFRDNLIQHRSRPLAWPAEQVETDKSKSNMWVAGHSSWSEVPITSNERQGVDRSSQIHLQVDMSEGVDRTEDMRESLSKGSTDREVSTDGSSSFRSVDKSQLSKARAARTHAVTLKEGVVEKRDAAGLHKLVNPWSTRRMVLSSETLCWSKLSHASFDVCVNLVHIEVVEASRAGGSESFDVVVLEGHTSAKIATPQKPKASRCTYTFRCRTKHKASLKERDAWISAIKAAKESATASSGQEARSKSPMSEEEDMDSSRRREEVRMWLRQSSERKLDTQIGDRTTSSFTGFLVHSFSSSLNSHFIFQKRRRAFEQLFCSDSFRG